MASPFLQRLSEAGLRACAVVPVYDNAGTVRAIVVRCLDHLPEVVVVDDGSTDGGTAGLESIEGVRVLEFGRNRGKGEALRAGLAEAGRLGYTHAVTIDADGQHDPAYIPGFLEAILRAPGAIITGVRRLEQAGAPGSSRFGRSFSNFWYSVETGGRVEDAQCGYRAYPVERTLALGTRARRYPMEHEVIVRAAWNGVPVLSDVEMDVRYGEDIVSHFDRFLDNFRFSGLNAALTLARWTGAWRLSKNEMPPSPGITTKAGAGVAGPVPKLPPWVHGRSLGNRAGYWWFEMLASTLGIEATYRFLDVVVTYYVMFAPREYREASMDYLCRAFPGAGESELRKHQWKHFRHFGETVVDHIVVPTLGIDSFRLTGEGLEHIKEAAKGGSGLILLGAHMGPWQFGAVALGHMGITVHIAAVTQEARAMDAYLARIRAVSKHPMPEILLIDEHDPLGSLTIASALRAGRVVALHADRHLRGRAARVLFLGAETVFPLGPFVLAEVTGAPICIWLAAKLDSRTIRITGHPPFRVRPGTRKDRTERLEEAARRYAALLEDHARAYPYQWYNFFRFWDQKQQPWR